ncbi:Nitric oxide reductase transcription regulator NorR2 [Sinobacterium norvegicum]|uniref:Nitric oxide reductase transcription regulator NorR2 n=1 Tax=Sinobacterium norvegicum TaxID=1641715 RepID=A0ABN8EN77_9GAMM|nr:nitric oxide reductase transcriptional regulator NorR [Sinobacterium norvegicum]CAH0991586.1 Nitric oxide reductase transcription regulator NorR2 [Sinobacterium norvegicum]
MTTENSAGIELIADLSRQLPASERYQRLLDQITTLFPCDAIALLKLEGEQLRPLAIKGLSQDTLGRRFKLDQHPRLSSILATNQPLRFPADSDLPDPYDGLVGDDCDKLEVHDCLGVTLIVDDIPWGVITLDALDPHCFDQLDYQLLANIISIAAATAKAAELIQALEQQVETQHQLTMSVLQQKQTEMIGKSTAMRSLIADLDAVAPSMLSVLITGETGAGKEVVAHHIHRQSERCNQPLVYINCAALPESIAESELFGHRKGAFTGAVDNRAGKFEMADGGTLFLDELGELPLPIQAKLLRAIQSGEIQRVGSDAPVNVDVRIITATNRNLKQEVKAGRFRADLYHRLSVFPVEVPPLRERASDIILLAGYMLEQEQHHFGIDKLRLAPSCNATLKQYHWPGNVRELHHLLSRAALKAVSSQRNRKLVTIDNSHLDITPSTTPNGPHLEQATLTTANQQDIDLKSIVDQFQIELIQQKLEQHQKNMAATARSLGLDRSNFYRLLKRLDIYTDN